MTKAQIREHKAGNKARKERILKLAKEGDESQRRIYGGMNVGQN